MLQHRDSVQRFCVPWVLTRDHWVPKVAAAPQQETMLELQAQVCRLRAILDLIPSPLARPLALSLLLADMPCFLQFRALALHNMSLVQWAGGMPLRVPRLAVLLLWDIILTLLAQRQGCLVSLDISAAASLQRLAPWFLPAITVALPVRPLRP